MFKAGSASKYTMAMITSSILLVLIISACGSKPTSPGPSRPIIISAPVGKTAVATSPATSAPSVQASRPAPSGQRVPATQRPYQIAGKTYYPIPSAQGFTETGIASWYGSKFHGRRTSNGEIYDMHAMTAAHKTLPMNTHLLVTNLENGKEITVRINDRGPFVQGRIIDLSYRGARELGMVEKGLARVRITALGEAVRYVEDGRSQERFVSTPDFEHGEFFVQIGSFGQRENAETLRRRLNEWGRNAILQQYEHEGRMFFRVQVTAGNNLSGAQRLERVMNEAGFPDAFVVAR